MKELVPGIEYCLIILLVCGNPLSFFGPLNWLCLKPKMHSLLIPQLFESSFHQDINLDLPQLSLS